MRLVLIFLVIFNSSCYEVQRDCNDFKTGRFQSQITLEGKTLISVFERFPDLQVEHFDNRTDSASVRWINDCEMIFKTLNPKNRIERKDIHIKILSTTKAAYTFEYGYVGESNKQKGIAKRLD